MPFRPSFVIISSFVLHFFLSHMVFCNYTWSCELFEGNFGLFVPFDVIIFSLWHLMLVFISIFFDFTTGHRVFRVFLVIFIWIEAFRAFIVLLICISLLLFGLSCFLLLLLTFESELWYFLSSFCQYLVIPTLNFGFFRNLYLLFWCFPLKTWLFSSLSSPSCKFCIWLWPFRAWYTHERVILSHFLPFLLNFVIILQCANLVLSFYAFFPYNFVIFTSYLCFAFVLFSLFIKLFIFQVNFGLFWPYFVILTLNLGFSCDIYPIFWGFSSEHLEFFVSYFVIL